jgi:hypothetical protein
VHELVFNTCDSNMHRERIKILINMLSIAEIDPLKLLVGNRTVLVKLYVASRVSSCCHL